MSSEPATGGQVALLIRDAASTAVRTHPVVPGRYLCGSLSSTVVGQRYVEIKGSGIPQGALRLDLTQTDRWTVEALVETGISLDGKIMQLGEKRSFNHLSVVDVFGARIEAGIPSTGNTDASKVFDLTYHQVAVLNDLLEYQRLNAHLLPFDDEPLRVERMGEQADLVLDAWTRLLQREDLFDLGFEALEKHLRMLCLAADDDPKPLPPSEFSRMSVSVRSQLQAVSGEAQDDLGLRMTKEDTQGDLEKISGRYGTFTKGYGRSLMTDDLARGLIIDSVRDHVMSQLFRMGTLETLLGLPVISEIMINAANSIFVEKSGRTFDTGFSFTSEAELAAIASDIARKDNRTIDAANPMLDARLSDGSRANVVLQPVSLYGTSIVIRKFSESTFSIHDLARRNTLNSAMLNFLIKAVQARKNIIVSGGTGTGKTTLLNALALLVPVVNRIITIEDTAELRLAGGRGGAGFGSGRNYVGLVARGQNYGSKSITIRDLVRNALRMKPDRIIVGECRGGETLDMLQAMNTGHEGSMTTAHANSPQDLLLRLEALVLQGDTDMPARAIRQQIAAALDLVVQIRRTTNMDPEKRKLGYAQRTIVEIAEIGEFDEDTGEIETFPVFETVDVDGVPEFAVSGYIPSFFGELIAAGDQDFDIHSLFEAEEMGQHNV